MASSINIRPCWPSPSNQNSYNYTILHLLVLKVIILLYMKHCSCLSTLCIIGVAGSPAGQALARPIFGAITIHNTVINSNKSESHSKKPELARWASFLVDSWILAISLLFNSDTLHAVRKDTPINDIT